MNVALLGPRLHSWRYHVLPRGFTTTTAPSEGFTTKIETARVHVNMLVLVMLSSHCV